MNDYNPERVLAVACPSCGVQPGEQCLTASGRKRNSNDFHATRKGVIYPSFATKRRGLNKSERLASEIVQKLENFVKARIGLSQTQTPGEKAEMQTAVNTARDALMVSLKEAFK